MAEFASSSRAVLRYAQETAFGVLPVAGDHYALPMTGESLNFALDKTQSEEINPNRGVTDVVATNASVSGSVNVELKASAYDKLIEAGMQGTWGAEAVTPLDITVTAGKLTVAGGAFPVANLVPGQFISIKTGNITALNYNRLLRISTDAGSISAQSLKLDPALPAGAETLTGVTISSSRLRNGTTRRSYTVEKGFTDIGIMKAYTGMNVAGFTLNAAQGALTKGEFKFMGRAALPKTTATRLPGTEVTLPDTRPMSGMTGTVCNVWVNGAPLAGTAVNSISLTLDNNLRAQNAMCSADKDGIAGAIGIVNGQLTVSGSLEVYFSSEDTLYEEFVKNRNVSLAFTAFDSEGNGYVFQMPKVNISNNQANASGNNQDIMAKIDFTGLQIKSADAALNGVVLTIDRIAFAG